MSEEPAVDTDATDEKATTSPAKVRFHYLKSSAFHTIHADGLIGGMTPRGNIHMAFYAERLPIPTQTEHSITAAGKLGDELRDERVCREGVVRELQIDVIFDLSTAINIQGWLNKQIELLKRQLPSSEKPAQEEASK